MRVDIVGGALVESRRRLHGFGGSPLRIDRIALLDWVNPGRYQFAVLRRQITRLGEEMLSSEPSPMSRSFLNGNLKRKIQPRETWPSLPIWVRRYRSAVRDQAGFFGLSWLAFSFPTLPRAIVSAPVKGCAICPNLCSFQHNEGRCGTHRKL